MDGDSLTTNLNSACIQCPVCSTGYCGYELLTATRWVNGRLKTLPLVPWNDHMDLRRHIAEGTCSKKRYGPANALQRWIIAIWSWIGGSALDWNVGRREDKVLAEDLEKVYQFVMWDVAQANEEPDTIRWVDVGRQDKPQEDASGVEAALEQATQLMAVELCEKVAAVAEDRCPGCQSAVETGDGFEISTVSCGNDTCPVRLFCVQCMRGVKWRPSDSAKKMEKCRCTRAPRGTECFNERWAEDWQPKIHVIANGITLQQRQLAVKALRELIIFATQQTVEEDNFVHMMFNRRAYTLIFDVLEQIGATDRMREAKGRELLRIADPTWVALLRAAADLKWEVNPGGAGKSWEEMGDLLMGIVSGTVVEREPWSDLGSMAAAVAGAKRTEVHVLSATSNGVNVRIYGYGVSKEGLTPMGLVCWKGELWQCVIRGRLWARMWIFPVSWMVGKPIMGVSSTAWG